MNKIIYVSSVLIIALTHVACDGEGNSAPGPAPISTVYVEPVCSDAGAPVVADAAPALDPCDGQYYRGMCDDRLLPFVWGFDKRCEDEGRVAYKSCADYNGPVPYRCPIRPTTREKCVEATGTSANHVILCCPEQ